MKQGFGLRLTQLVNARSLAKVKEKSSEDLLLANESDKDQACQEDLLGFRGHTCSSTERKRQTRNADREK